MDPGVDPSAVPAIVYTWVNGSDPAVIAACASVGGSCKGSSRTNADRNELKYSLRSIEKYAPWFNGLVVIISNEVRHTASSCLPVGDPVASGGVPVVSLHGDSVHLNTDLTHSPFVCFRSRRGLMSTTRG